MAQRTKPMRRMRISPFDYAERRKNAFEFGARCPWALMWCSWTCRMPISLHSWASPTARLPRSQPATTTLDRAAYTTVLMQLAATLCDCIVICISPSPIISHCKCNDDDDDDVDELDTNTRCDSFTCIFFRDNAVCPCTHCASKVLTVKSWVRTVERNWVERRKKKRTNERGEPTDKRESPVLNDKTNETKKTKNHFHNFSAFLFTWENNTQIHFLMYFSVGRVMQRNSHRCCCFFNENKANTFNFWKCNTHTHTRRAHTHTKCHL